MNQKQTRRVWAYLLLGLVLVGTILGAIFVRYGGEALDLLQQVGAAS